MLTITQRRQLLAVHLSNAEPGSALDGAPSRKSRRSATAILIGIIPVLGAGAVIAEYLRWWLS